MKQVAKSASSALKMEATCPSETPIYSQRTPRRYIAEDRAPQIYDKLPEQEDIG
jgi:hypothetical protein